MSEVCGEIIECDKCKGLYDSNSWERGLTYKGIDKHHNPPEFISERLGEPWSGEFYNLCRKCHVDLHKEIKQILFRNSNCFKFVNSEFWLMQHMTLQNIKKAKEEIYLFTKEWVKNGNSNF